MVQQELFRNSTKAIAVAAFCALPTALFAGGLGTAGVADATVGQQTAQGDTVWCPRLDALITSTLYAQMDCGGGFAQPAVANNRVTNRGGLFGLGAHEPGPRVQNDDDNDPSPRPRNDDTSDPGPTLIVDKTPPKDDPTPTASPVDKWDRLSDFGVNQDNFFSQSDEFRENIKEFRESGNPDWSSFNPDE